MHFCEIEQKICWKVSCIQILLVKLFNELACRSHNYKPVSSSVGSSKAAPPQCSALDALPRHYKSPEARSTNHTIGPFPISSN